VQDFGRPSTMLKFKDIILVQIGGSRLAIVEQADLTYCTTVSESSNTRYRNE
jgi:hypothetical protein